MENTVTKQTIGLLAIFRNEAHCLEEFILHYLKQGIDHFYLINNASTDNYEQIIFKYDRFITLKQEPFISNTIVLNTGGKQIEAYNKLLPEIKTDWVYVCDLDEFAYARLGQSCFKTFINKHGNKDYAQFLIPLKTFSSSGIIEQPSSLVKNFVTRKVENYPLFKPLVKTNMINRISINYCLLKDGLSTNTSFTEVSDKFIGTGRSISSEFVLPMRHLDTNKLNNSQILSNHYTTQSKNWFFNVKATRGTATWHGGPQMPAIEWFGQMWQRAHAGIQVQDVELKKLYES